jgi:hypothetical protein
MRATSPKRRMAVVLILFGLYILWGFGWDTVGHMLRTSVDGVIVASRDFPATGAPRYATEYTIRGADGKDRVYVAGATDASLERSMSVGTRIRKLPWHLDYERDGTRVRFPTPFYATILGIALGLVIWGTAHLWPSRRDPALLAEDDQPR